MVLMPSLLTHHHSPPHHSPHHNPPRANPLPSGSGESLPYSCWEAVSGLAPSGSDHNHHRQKPHPPPGEPHPPKASSPSGSKHAPHPPPSQTPKHNSPTRANKQRPPPTHNPESGPNKHPESGQSEQSVRFVPTNGDCSRSNPISIAKPKSPPNPAPKSASTRACFAYHQTPNA